LSEVRSSVKKIRALCTLMKSWVNTGHIIQNKFKDKTRKTFLIGLSQKLKGRVVNMKLVCKKDIADAQ
jgi:hypothetical protein